MFGISHHIDHGNSFKGVCASYVIGSFGIKPNQYEATWDDRLHNEVTLNVIRKFGFTVESRDSILFETEERVTVGQLRGKLKKLTDPIGTKYIVQLHGHMILLNQLGETVVDTDSRKLDRREAIDIHAVWKA